MNNGIQFIGATQTQRKISNAVVTSCDACHMCVCSTRLAMLLLGVRAMAGPPRGLARTDPSDRTALDAERYGNTGSGLS